MPADQTDVVSIPDAEGETTEDQVINGTYTIDEATEIFAASDIVAIPVTDGNIYFDTLTGTITSADKTISIAYIPGQINGVNVVNIANNAFSSCTALTSITLPNTLTTIGYRAFRSCTSLTSVTIPASVYMTGTEYGVDEYSGRWFAGCTNLTTITLESGMTTIPIGAFADIPASFSITIPETVTTIKNQAFRNTSITAVIPADDNQQNTYWLALAKLFKVCS